MVPGAISHSSMLMEPCTWFFRITTWWSGTPAALASMQFLCVPQN
jgi:hypothetical protein